uniref:Uncharacterized protein n=1 Tax=Arion vulgaris TaxID=1028688 RepID=A0A0B7A5N8_9EUPU
MSCWTTTRCRISTSKFVPEFMHISQQVTNLWRQVTVRFYKQKNLTFKVTHLVLYCSMVSALISPKEAIRTDTIPTV